MEVRFLRGRMMRQVIEKSFLDWSRDHNQKIQARGIEALLALKAKTITAQSNANSRCVWPSVFEHRNSRYLSRRMDSFGQL